MNLSQLRATSRDEYLVIEKYQKAEKANNQRRKAKPEIKKRLPDRQPRRLTVDHCTHDKSNIHVLTRYLTSPCGWVC